MNMISHQKLTQNLKTATIMKATGYKDSEIASFIGISTAEFLEFIAEDSYLKELFANASQKVATEVETKFLKKMMEKLDEGDSADAKFFMERTMPKYSRKDNVTLTGELSIDEIIKNNSEPKDK